MSEGRVEAELPWITAAVDQRVAEVTERVGGDLDRLMQFGFIVFTLTDEPEGEEAVRQWERSCDRCGLYCPDDTEFFTGTAVRIIDDRQIIVMFGVCPQHAEQP